MAKVQKVFQVVKWQSTEKFSSQVVKMAKEYSKVFKSSRKNGKEYRKVFKSSRKNGKRAQKSFQVES